MEAHERTVSEISKRIKSFHERQQPFRVYHGATNSTRVVSFDPRTIVDTSSLSNIFSIDKENGCAIVEPNVAMDQLVEETLKYGLVPPVIPEFPGITVGGAFSGTAAESSSFKYGYFDRAVNWVEIVLADGEIVKASNTELSDLFSGIVGVFGTLGVTTLFEIKLIRAARYIEATYIPVSNMVDAISTIRKCADDVKYDFVDGIVFGPKHSTYGVIVVGHMTDTRAFKGRRFNRAKDPWFYLHALRSGSCTESIPIVDYLFRYDRGAFWMGRFSFGLIPFNRITRWMLDPLMRTRKMYEAMHAMGRSQHFIIQDLVMPADTVEQLIDYLEKNISIYPLWLCPIRANADAFMQQHPCPTDLLINVGVWGYTRDTLMDFEEFKKKNRDIEKTVKELGGLKWLYAHTYYTEEEFWNIYNRPKYDALRTKYHAETLPGIYQKVRSKDEFQKSNATKGFLSAIIGKTSLLSTK